VYGYVVAPDADPDNTAELTRQLMEVSALTGVRVAGLLGRLGLTSPLAAALCAIDPDQPAIPMSQLALVLGCDRSNVTLISEKLESEGLAERRPHPTDRRARVLALTSRGCALRRRLTAEVAASTGLDRLTSLQRRRLRTILTKLCPPT